MTFLCIHRGDGEPGEQLRRNILDARMNKMSAKRAMDRRDRLAAVIGSIAMAHYDMERVRKQQMESIQKNRMATVREKSFLSPYHATSYTLKDATESRNAADLSSVMIPMATIERQGKQLADNRGKIERNSQQISKNAQALDVLEQLAQEVKQNNQRIAEASDSNKREISSRIETGLQDQADVKDKLFNYMSQTNQIQDRIKKRLDEQAQIIKLQQDVIEKLYSNAGSFKQGQTRLAEGLSDYGQTKQTLRNVSNQVNDLISKSRSLSDILSTMAKETKQELRDAQERFEKNKLGNAKLHDNLNSQLRDHYVALRRHQSESKKLIEGLQRKMERLNQLNQTSNKLSNDLKDQTARINQLKEATRKHDSAFEVVENMINLVHDHVEQLKRNKAEKGSLQQLQQKVEDIETKNSEMRDKLGLQKSTVQRLDAFILKNLNNMTDKLREKVSNNEFQTLHQAAEMYSNELENMNRKHRNLNHDLAQLRESIRDLSQHHAGNISELENAQKQSTAEQLERIGDMRSMLDDEKATVSKMMTEMAVDKDRVAKIVANLKSLGSVVARFELTRSKQMLSLSEQAIRSASENESRGNSFASKIQENTRRAWEEKRLLNELAANTSAGFSQLLREIQKTDLRLSEQEQSILLQDKEIANNKESIGSNGERLETLESETTHIKKNYLHLKETMKSSDKEIEERMAENSKKQEEIKSALEQQNKLILQETENIKKMTNKQHADAMRELVNIKERLDEESSQWSNNLHERMNSITGSINNASAKIQRLREKNDKFLKIMDAMKADIQRQKEEETSQVGSLVDKLTHLSAKLNNQRMAAGEQASTTQTRIQAMEADLQKISGLQGNQARMQSFLDAESNQLNKVRVDVQSQGQTFERHLTQLADQVEKGINKALMTKASRIEMNELKDTMSTLRKSKEDLSKSFQRQSATFSNLHSSIERQLSTIEEDITKKASSIELDSMKEVMEMAKNQLNTLSKKTDNKISALSSALTIYSEKIGKVLTEKEKNFQTHMNYSHGLSDSINNLEQSLTTMENRLADAKKFERETKTTLLDQITRDKQQIERMIQTQNLLREMIPSLSNKTEVDTLDAALKDTDKKVRNNRIHMNARFDTMDKSLKNQRGLLTTLAEETSSGFSSILTQLGGLNRTVKELKKTLEAQAEKIKDNKEKIAVNKENIAANKEHGKMNQAKIDENKDKILMANSMIEKTNEKLALTDDEVTRIKEKILTDETMSRTEETEIQQLNLKELNLQEEQKTLKQEVNSDTDRIGQLEKQEEADENRLAETRRILGAVKASSILNAERADAIQSEVFNHKESITANSGGIEENRRTLEGHRDELARDSKILVEHETKIGKDESLIESQGRDISHFMEGKAQELVNSLTTENSEDVNYLVEFGARNDGMLVSGLVKVSNDDTQHAMSVCIKAKIFSLNGRRNVLSLAIKEGMHYEIFLRMIFIMSSNAIDQVQLKTGGVTQVIRLTMEKGEKQHVFCFNEENFFVNERQFQFSSNLDIFPLLQKGISVILGHNDLSDSTNEPVTVTGFDAMSAQGFEGVVEDVSVWGESMEGWYNHRANLFQDFGCSWNDPEGKKLVDFEKNVITGSKVYGTTNVSLNSHLSKKL